ncbi:hypothetical protein M9H77_20500 [Catharanthus roseus]|uniref:Uncharacterized protein n=1 Tax=Catharanthus roseus TaxID=4058 RepID=A0ACC0AL63_CATRO|nr:hypothetical protein M9H77_20500 [Catharanthus roseus]
MTSASELFHSRRSRFGRISLHEFGGGEGDSNSSSNFYHNRISHTNNNNFRRYRNINQHQSSSARRDHHRIDSDGCDPPPRRPTHLRHRPFLPDRELVRSDQATDHHGSATVNNSDSPRATQDRDRLSGNDRLPGTVLLARERLLRRLRGVSLSENRQRNRVSPNTRQSDTTVEDDFRFADVGDWESEILREPVSVPFPEVLTVEKHKRPPGLSQEAVKNLQVVMFSKIEKCEEEIMSSRVFQDCSICLESFMEGEKLICLPCGHRFHYHCLDPWVRVCGDCPYCRMQITVSGGCRGKER